MSSGMEIWGLNDPSSGILWGKRPSSGGMGGLWEGAGRRGQGSSEGSPGQAGAKRCQGQGDPMGWHRASLLITLGTSRH